MIRALRKKFIVTAMIAVSVLLILLLGLFNGMNVITNRRETAQLLEMLGRGDAIREPVDNAPFPTLPDVEEKNPFVPMKKIPGCLRCISAFTRRITAGKRMFPALQT